MPTNRSWAAMLILFTVALLLAAGHSATSSAHESLLPHAAPMTITLEPARTGTQLTAWASTSGNLYLPSVMKDHTRCQITINEVMPKAASGEAEWVELYNPGPEVVQVDGYQITDLDGNPYAIPAALPAVPVGAFVLVLFDGVDKGSNDYDFGDNLATLHTPPRLTNVFEDDADQVALYSESARDADSLVAFVAWGPEPGDDANHAVEAGMWAAEWYVSFARGGIHLPEDLLVPNESIGLYPGSETHLLDQWMVYGEGDLTPGAENRVPGPSWYTPVDGTTIDPEGFAIAWEMVANATGYRFQLDDDPAFGSPEVNTTLSEPYYEPTTPIPEGTYYWRVQTIDADGRRSAWSGGVQIIVMAIPPTPQPSGVSDVGLTGLDFGFLGITWQLQHKDTRMLCLGGCPETGRCRWDSSHERDGDWNVGNGRPVRANLHDNWYCVRASVSMMTSYYGCTLSQDRISYDIFGGGAPEGDLGHGKGTTVAQARNALSWALGTPIATMVGKPTFLQIKNWIKNKQPIMTARLGPGHMRVIDGFFEFDAFGIKRERLHVLDPWNKDSWVDYATFPIVRYWVGPPAPVNPRTCVSDEDVDRDATADTIDDSDGDGMCDFDERTRFNTNPLWRDSDNDCVEEKKDVRGYVFTNAGVWIPRGADCDNDGLRKELDRDNDNGGRIDGDEDANRNGKSIDILWARDGTDTSNFSPILGFPDDIFAPSRCAVPATPTPTRTPTRTRTPTPTPTPTVTRTPTRLPGGILTGRVVCATTGTGIAGATVRVQGTGLSTATDASGDWSISNVPAGEQTLEVFAQGYTTATQPVNVVAGANPPVTIAMASVSGDVTIVLTWGERPADLDAHAGGRDTQNLGDADGRFHIYYLNRAPVTYAGLDHDDTSSYGPETFSIRVDPDIGAWLDCIYTYWVHNYSGSPGFEESNALVTIYKGGVQIAQYTVSAEPGVGSAGNLWRVCDLAVDAQGQVTIDRSVRGFYSGSGDSVFCPGSGGPQSICASDRLFTDDFSDPNSGWPHEVYDYVTAGYDDDNYRIVINHDYWACWAWPGFQCDSCSTEVTAWRCTGQGSSYGIIFGIVDHDNYYLFRVHPGRQEYSLFRKQSGSWNTLISATSSDNINGGDSQNCLKVTHQGSLIRLYVNGHRLAEANDSTFTGSRAVGLYGESEAEYPVNLRYDNFIVSSVGGAPSLNATGSGGAGGSRPAKR